MIVSMTTLAQQTLLRVLPTASIRPVPRYNLLKQTNLHHVLNHCLGKWIVENSSLAATRVDLVRSMLHDKSQQSTPRAAYAVCKACSAHKHDVVHEVCQTLVQRVSRKVSCAQELRVARMTQVTRLQQALSRALPLATECLSFVPSHQVKIS